MLRATRTWWRKAVGFEILDKIIYVPFAKLTSLILICIIPNALCDLFVSLLAWSWFHFFVGFLVLFVSLLIEGARLAPRWEHTSSTNVAWVRFILDSMCVLSWWVLSTLRNFSQSSPVFPSRRKFDFLWFSLIYTLTLICTWATVPS